MCECEIMAAGLLTYPIPEPSSQPYGTLARISDLLAPIIQEIQQRVCRGFSPRSLFIAVTANRRESDYLGRKVTNLFPDITNF